MSTAEQVLESSVHALPPSERLRLAAMILQELAQSDLGALNYADSWSEQDIADLQAHALRYASTHPQRPSGAARK